MKNLSSFPMAYGINRRNNDNLARDVGNLIIGLATVESLFIVLLARALGTSEENAEIVFRSHQNSRSWERMIVSLAHHNLPTNIDTIKGLFQRLKFPRSVRNKYAHSEYVADVATGEYTHLVVSNLDHAGSKNPTFDERPLNSMAEKEIKKAFENLIVINQELLAFVKSI